MGIFSRLTDIVNSNIVSMLDRAENPEKMIRLMIQEMEDTLVEIKSETAKHIADKKYLERKLEALKSDVTKWQEKAELAISKDREDLAKLALVEKSEKLEKIEQIQSELTDLQTAIEKYRDDILKLEEKLVETKAKKSQIARRADVAGKQLNVRKQLKKADSEKAIIRMERLERRVDEMESEIELHDLRPKSLEDEFKALEGESEIDKELQALKEKMNK